MAFFESPYDVRLVSLAEWLDWAGSKTNKMFVALPMIQRGSVWQPHQIIELWDSLLRGMPIGSMMVSELPAGVPVRRPGKHRHEVVPAGGGLGLIDGQQRTLAMLVAWQPAEKMDRRLWLDFRDKPLPGQLLRLRITTKNQPFGFQRNEPSRKLSLGDRRKAHEAFKTLKEQIEPKLDNAWPFSHVPGLPIDLGWLIDTWRQKSVRGDWLKAVNDSLQDLQGAEFVRTAEQEKWRKVTVWQTLDDPEKAEVHKRVEALADALARLQRLMTPLIPVDERFFDTKGPSINN